MRRLALLAILVLFAGSRPVVRGQDEERIKKLFEDAIQAMGGDTFLKVTSIVSEGNYFAIDREGMTRGLARFNDYTQFPGKSRFEIGSRRLERDVTVFNLDNKEGWIMEGQKEPRAATPEDFADFKKAVKHSIETIFRFRYQNPENKVFYLGISDQDPMLEMVKMIDPENDDVTVYFDRMSHLPAKLEYRRVDRRGVHIREVQEFSQWHMIQGVNTTMRIDAYENGRQVSQMFVEKVTYNSNIPDSMFSKPTPPK